MLEKFVNRAQRKILTRLLAENFASQGPWYGIAIVAMIVVACMTSASAWVMRDIVNASVVSKDIDRVFFVSGLVALIFTVKGVATYIQSIFLSKAGNNIIARTQTRLFNHVLKQGIDFYAKYTSSDLLMRITSNAQAARAVIDLVVTSFVRDALSLIGLVAVMVVQQPLLSLIAAVIGPCSILGVRVLTKKVRKIMEQELASLGMIIQNVQETATGIKVVKSFGLEAYMRERMEKYVRDVETRANSIAKLEAASSPVMETLSGFAIAGVVAISGIWVLQEGNTPGELMSFITALLLAYEPAKRLARMRISLESGIIGVRMMYELADHPIDLKERDDAIDLPPGQGEVRLQKVGFSYSPGYPLFDQLDLAFPAGRTTALVGASGGGKSSIINLIMRLYDPEQGSVSIDGVDLRQVTFRSLRARMAYVGQDTFLFSGTIRHNIALGREGATEDEIIDAAKAANAHDFIMRLPNGYDSQVGENGGNLSGGQKQRITIARAMLRKADILILDEATSALDSESEVLIQEALFRLTRGKTTIMIAHRLSSIAVADNIVVMDAGRVLEQGTPNELLSHDGAFRRLYELQILPPAEAVA
ncbi:ATP-binding cassette subfamily B protein [Neorhizobium galegae]|uniref:ABC transporter ATP-binding protein n=1 Tax=Neorhizobium galegae TaxID=399 RepID=UPI001AE31197|nr:ABC transporter ATP-binding protein [Neorhizobium galegae]MBP2550974.1 ATP-binding cassette subfamily B protein [Neorhizobium galegae]